MNRYTLVIADSSEDFCSCLQSQFEYFCQVFCCSTGREALELVRTRHPDVLVLDLLLKELDGLSLLGCLEATGDRPGILADTSYVSPYILETAERLGVSYLLEKPCSMEKTAELIRRLLKGREFASPQDRFTRISGLLLRLGFTAKLRGYSYLRDAVLKYAEDPAQSILKELYPSVALPYGVSAEDVEHSIRSAAMVAWNHGSREIWGLYFAQDGKFQRPSNAALIQGLAKSMNGSYEQAAALNQ